ncbi:MG2 domain-containing protein [Sphingomonas cannabina]|uniref:alpha-2-macroglobulin family protein n=1 Tax=Sphingomonas cannabina TaxID=2899123 RepID=UPI001F3AF7BD|nr:MG2 domain-containing protein [Sphingomonas cannabina]UIJ45927.1 MG2 domain-containing protein [Sphingomonas cannabina]
MKLAVRLAILAAALAPLTAQGDASPRVILATPGIGDGAIERFTLRFSAAMVPLGDPRAKAPAASACAGEGRWVDQSTWVYEFASPLPGGTTCEFNLAAGLKSVSGYEVTGNSTFKVDSGGPIARAVLPGNYDGEIEEDQVFLVAAAMAPDRASVGANAYCAVDGLGEKIPVDVLDAALPGKLLSELGIDRWQVSSFLSSANLPSALPAEAKARDEALASVIAVKCRRPLPPGRDMALVWGAGVSAAGRTAGADQRFDFTVRKPFTARFECSRVNPQAGCNPVKDAYVRFSAPIPRAQAEAIRIALPDGKTLTPKIDKDDQTKAVVSQVSFSAPLPAATTAKLTLPADVKDESGRPLSNAERFPLDVRFDAAPPLVKFAAVFGVLEAEEGGVLPVTVRAVEPSLGGQVASVSGQTLKVDASDADVAAWLRRLDEHEESDFEEVKRGDETVTINNTASKPLIPAGRGAALNVGLPGKGKEFEVVGIPLKQPGFYVVELASPALGRALLGRDAPRYVTAGALVTNMSVHFKWGREGSLAWVTELSSGKPVAGADVRVSDSCTGAILARGATDAEGRFLVTKGLPDPETYGSCEDNSTNHPLMISARKAGDFAFDLTSWGEGIRPYDFDLPYGWSERSEVVHTVFDRALVRQGETVHMKHIVRVPNGAGFRMGEPFTGTLKLSHRGSDTQFELPLSIDANGTGENEWTAPQGAPMGDYDVQMVVGDRTISSGQSFKVDEYKLPTMKATVTGPKEAQVRPKTMPLDLYAGYLSGGGASNLPVDLRIGYFRRSATPANYDAYTFGGAAVKEGVQPLNGDGEDADEAAELPPTQSLPVTLGGDGTGKATVDVPALDAGTDMLVEMDYQDANGETLTASRRIPIYASAVQLGVRTDGWLMKQDDLRLKLVALDTDGNPIAGQRVEVALYSREILTARRRLIGGFYAYDNQAKTTKLSGSCSTTTDKLGLAECQLDPGVSGEVYAVATTTDANGNVARAVRSVWLVGDDDWWFGGDNGDRMDVIPEQAEYKAGETAKFQVRMPFRNATALVTVEREGVLSSFVTQLSGTDPVVEVPMPGTYAPDVFVSVMAVRGRVGGWWLWLSNLARDWGLPWFSREGARPTATVDLAKPAYRLGIAKVKVGWEAHRLGVEVKADKGRYAVRDTAEVDVAVRGPDGKPAASADVAFVAVDEALLQLAPNDSWDLLTAMMGERPISVLTSTAQMQVVGKRHYGRKTAEPGGGGGGDLSGLNRENFQPVLLWRGRLALDGNGHARVAVPLSDALSSFKLVAVATSGPQLFGTGETSVRTSQDLQIFAGLPPLVRTGDWYAAGFTLRNASDRPMKVSATVEVTPAIARGRPIEVTIPAGGAVPVAWNLTAPSMPGNLSWKVTARSADGKASDAITVAQEVAPAVPVEVWASSLTRVGEATSLVVGPPAGALPGLGSVEVSLTDTLAPPLAGVRDYMAAYPYSCFEQRLSRAVALGDGGMWTALAGEMPTYLDGDGLLRYWPSETLPGSEALTAYVLALTSEAGLPVPEAPRGRMIEALKAVLDGRLRHEDYGDVRLQRLNAFAALARAGAATPDMLGQIGLAPNEMPTASLADYIVALGKVPGLANGAALRSQAEDVLRTRLVYEGTRLDLSDKDNAPWWLMSSGDESAIKALLAVLGRPGWQDDAAKMMVGVAQRQQRGHWDNTTANAWGTVLAQRFMAMYPAEAIAGITTASLGSSSISRSWPLAPDQRRFSLALPAAQAPLRLAQSGGSGPWAFVTVKAAVPLRQPLNAGYKMTKAVEVVQARTKGQLTRGDVIKVTITVDASAERNWVVVSDPVPAGATVVGGAANQSSMLGDLAGAGEGVSPSYIERGKDAWRAYFAWVPRGTFKVSYVMRLNGVGRLQVPPTRVEAMYSPAIRAQWPNQPMVVTQR